MTNIYKTLLTIILSPIVLAGCIIYPQVNDIPLISKKSDLKVDAGISLVPAAHATVSYGLTNKIAVQAFGSLGSDEHRYLQGAIGYFKNTGNNNVMEIYAGFGSGHGSAYKDSNPGDLHGNYQLGFAQFNFGKINSKFAHMDYGIGIKTGFLTSILTDQNYFDIYAENDPFPTYKDNGIILQPTAFVSLGGERLKFNIKISNLWYYKLTNKDKDLPIAHFNAGVSLNYRINTNRGKE